MDAAEHDHFGVRLGRLSRQRERIACEIGDAVEYLGCLIIVRQDYGFALAFYLIDGGNIGRMHRPFDLRDDAA